MWALVEWALDRHPQQHTKDGSYTLFLDMWTPLSHQQTQNEYHIYSYVSAVGIQNPRLKLRFLHFQRRMEFKHTFWGKPVTLLIVWITFSSTFSPFFPAAFVCFFDKTVLPLENQCSINCCFASPQASLHGVVCFLFFSWIHLILPVLNWCSLCPCISLE